MQPTPPGWYWDPGNRPGLFRWWDGHAWSGELTPDRNDPPPHPPDLPAPDVDGRYRAGGLSVPALPDPWRPCPGYPDIDGVQGQEVVVGKTPRGPYLGAIFIGGLPASTEYAGHLDTAGLAFADAMLHTYYPHERPHDALAPEPATVDGHAAWRLAVPLDVDDPALSFTTEEALFVLVDVDAARPGVLFASLPGVAGVPSADEVFTSLTVSRAASD
ncbi:DUF2510 domain-containing protein [Nocardioides speluncae]|uniref:DUF2510 domain-containing protein n=1 Tax=Nocardioides speluncae TaxID=2670337 RepID=UPI00197DD552|nr:DUF2510 domain-containing protein [Nocardioides speluncae]